MHNDVNANSVQDQNLKLKLSLICIPETQENLYVYVST